jgi:subtilisin family serine protease
MKQSHLIFFLLLFFCQNINADDFFYYCSGKKVPLAVKKNQVVILIPITYNQSPDLESTETLDVIEDNYYTILNKVSTNELDDQDDLYERAQETYMDDSQINILPCFMSEDGADLIATNYINIRLKELNDIGTLKEMAARYHLNIVGQDKYLQNWYTLSITPETRMSPLLVANTLYETGLFSESLPDLSSQISTEGVVSTLDPYCPNDPDVSKQWGIFKNEDSGYDINLFGAWEYATGKNVRIGIFDTGIDSSHHDLIANMDSKCYDCETGTAQALLYNEHGTHCAGIAAATANNDYQIAGVAPEATLIPICKNFDTKKENSGMKIADGFSWAWKNGIDIISCSWHLNNQHPAVVEAIDSALIYGRGGKGCVIVFAAGNQSKDQVSYPGSSRPDIITVGSITSSGSLSYFSNHGTGLDVVAPGSDILSTLPNNTQGYKDGTSMACPHVSGVAALLLSRNPTLSQQQVAEVICSTARKIREPFVYLKEYGTWDQDYGYGLIDAESAVLAVSDPDNGETTSMSTPRTDLISIEKTGRMVSIRSEVPVNGYTIFGQNSVIIDRKTVQNTIGNVIKLPIYSNDMIILVIQTEAGNIVRKIK